MKARRMTSSHMMIALKQVNAVVDCSSCSEAVCRCGLGRVCGGVTALRQAVQALARADSWDYR